MSEKIVNKMASIYLKYIDNLKGKLLIVLYSRFCNMMSTKIRDKMQDNVEPIEVRRSAYNKFCWTWKTE